MFNPNDLSFRARRTYDKVVKNGREVPRTRAYVKYVGTRLEIRKEVL